MRPTPDDHRVLRHLDAPTRWVIWTPDECVLCVGPLLGLYALTQHLGLGLLVGLSMSVGAKTVKQRVGVPQLWALWAWHVPWLAPRSYRGSQTARLFLG